LMASGREVEVAWRKGDQGQIGRGWNNVVQN